MLRDDVLHVFKQVFSVLKVEFRVLGCSNHARSESAVESVERKS